jgi:hypothetical protein
MPTYLNTVWGHVIYAQPNQPKFVVPYGKLKTLADFLAWRRKRDLPEYSQASRYKPVILEIYLSIGMDRKLTDEEVSGVASDLTIVLIDAGFGTFAKDEMEWGYDWQETDYRGKGFFESALRISRTGDDFQETDLTGLLDYVKKRLAP